jgi:hemin uptake protein HemP
VSACSVCKWPAHTPWCVLSATEKKELSDMAIKSITSAELFESRQEIIIIHAGEQYRLRITNNNKLILTK